MSVDGGKRLVHVFKVKNNIKAITFTNKIGLITENENYRPMIVIKDRRGYAIHIWVMSSRYCFNLGTPVEV